jgi:hypothetical protein
MNDFEQGFKDELAKLAAKFKLRPPKIKAPKGEAKSPLTKVKSPAKKGGGTFYVGK